MRAIRTTGTALAILLVAACARPAPQLASASDADVAAVAKVLAAGDSLARNHALDAWMNLMADDFVALFADQPALVGKAAARGFYGGLLNAFVLEGHHQPVETYSIGDLVISRGNFSGTMTRMAGGQPIASESKYIILFRRQADGSLKVWRAAANTNAPPAPLPAAAPRR